MVPPVVVDEALDAAACAEACAAALAFFDGAGDRRIAEQALHRGDDVAFVPLFGEDEGSPLRQALGPARRLLARAAADIGDADLLVPEVAQLALYAPVSEVSFDTPSTRSKLTRRQQHTGTTAASATSNRATSRIGTTRPNLVLLARTTAK